MTKLRQTIWESRLYRSVLLALILVSGGMVAFFLTVGHHYLSPGPVSALGDGHAISGFSAHADFEQECNHCHAPIHCVTDDKCQGCHMEIAEERMQADALHGRLPGTERCQNCHIEHQGRDGNITQMAVTNLNHAGMSGFSLAQHAVDYDGREIACADCHSHNNYSAEALDCVSCHEPVAVSAAPLADHMAQYGRSCTTCHDGQDRLAQFSHDAIFPLDGGHASPLTCADCHPNQQYANTPAACADCHQQPDLHSAAFGTDCQRCHTSDAWTPARLTQHTFDLNHGSDETLPCETCHSQSYTTYPCEDCHLPAEMGFLHLNANIVEWQNCLSCHPTGRPGEALTPLASR